ncbi:MAG: protein translocase subunit SecF [Synergistetes bacterium]|nr:protein translocase subunit SecF [Synergistota bacterium]
MLFFKSVPKIDFMGKRRIALLISAILVLTSVGFLAVKGLNPGIDFAGGTLMQVQFKHSVSVGDVRSVLSKFGLGRAVIQKYSDNGVMIRTKQLPIKERRKVVEALNKALGVERVLKVEMVGPTVGSDLRRQAAWAVTFALIGILIYISWRFQFRFAVVSIIALVHDSLITLGVFSMLHREINMVFIAAILTIIGYSLNDTIVVLDRIRENMRGIMKMRFIELINLSINQTLSRTINTSLTTILPVITLYIYGGEVLSNFALAFLVGIISGTYSSIYVASALLVEWDLWSKKGKKTARLSAPQTATVNPSATPVEKETKETPQAKVAKPTGASKKRSKKRRKSKKK